MNQNFVEFRTFLKDQNLNEDQIETSLGIINRFSDFLSYSGKKLETVSYNDLYTFSETLIEDASNTIENYAALYRFANFQKNNELIIATLEI
ncbi:MAG: hypothetical protein ACFFD3_17355, partial [Candidatus Thorarchaeota archaeon]